MKNLNQNKDTFSYLKYCLKNCKFILLVSSGFMFFGLMYSLSTPAIYSATSRIMPPQQQNSLASTLIGQLGGVGGAAGGLVGIKNPNDLYVGILQSDSVISAVADKFKLREKYKLETYEDVRKKVLSNASFFSGKDNLINISFEDESPELSAEVANYFVYELIRQTQRLAVTEAGMRRVFFEREFLAQKKRLEDAESKLAIHQEANGILQLDVQVQSNIAAVASIKAEIAAKKIRLDSMLSYATSENPVVSAARAEIFAMEKQLGKLEMLKPGVASDGNSLVSKSPEFIKYYRNVKYNEALYELISKQYELARLDEAKDAGIIQVLDVAKTPQKKIRPITSLILPSFFLVGFIVACFITLYRWFALCRSDGGGECL